MKTIKLEIKLYSFEELSEEAKQNAINEMYDLNTSHDWWDCIYEDANNIGCQINGFNLDKGQSINFAIINDHIEIAYSILKERGKDCNGYELANKFIADFKNVSDESDELDNLEAQFQRDLGCVYFKILQNEYEHLTSDEAIIESIKANEYDFLENGTQY